MNKHVLEKNLSEKEKDLVKKMAEAGVHFGHTKSRRNPKMTPYIYSWKNNIYIIDLTLTLEKLNHALKFIKETVKKKGVILFVGIQPSAKKIVKDVAKECGMPYVTERWLGGLLTNFKTIRQRVEHLLSLEKKKKSGDLKKYTKKEQMLFGQEIEKLNKILGGIKNLNKLPETLFVLGVKHNLAAIKEARRKKIPVVSLVDTDSDPTLVDYPIPSNDEALSALKFMLEQVKEVIVKNKK